MRDTTPGTSMRGPTGACGWRSTSVDIRGTTRTRRFRYPLRAECDASHTATAPAPGLAVSLLLSCPQMPELRAHPLHLFRLREGRPRGVGPDSHFRVIYDIAMTFEPPTCMRSAGLEAS